MNALEVTREVHRRLKFHAEPERMLHGLKVRKSGQYRIEGENQLPQFCFVDITGDDRRGGSNATLSCWLRVARKHEWFKDTDEGPHGLIDWMLLIMDAVETMPSDGTPDQLLVRHDDYGQLRLDDHGRRIELLGAPCEWHVQVDEISDLALTLQMNLSFTFPATKRARRRLVPHTLPLRVQNEVNEA
jgi:hypothetical protein